MTACSAIEISYPRRPHKLVGRSLASLEECDHRVRRRPPNLHNTNNDDRCPHGKTHDPPTPPGRSRDGHFGWYRALDKQERRAFWSCKIGYGLDGMDTQMLSFVIPTLIALWGIGTGEAGFIHTMTLLASAAGAGSPGSSPTASAGC